MASLAIVVVALVIALSGALAIIGGVVREHADRRVRRPAINRAQLVNEIPPAVLGQLIAISPTTASRWATLTNSNWNAYAGQPPRQSHAQDD